MSFQSTFAKAGLTGVASALALAGALAVPSFASAQSSGYYDNNNSGAYYDPCRRESTNRATTGGVLGALAGAAIGSNLAAHHGGRTGGAALGGVVGAVAGANIGKNSAACSPGQQRQGYYNNGQTYYGSNYDNRGYDNRGYEGERYYDRSRNDDYAADRYGNAYPVTQRPADANGCALAESPIYLPDGRVQKRFVRVCPDSNGRYQVVD
jgi:uncharacterized protein YcfJ